MPSELKLTNGETAVVDDWHYWWASQHTWRIHDDGHVVRDGIPSRGEPPVVHLCNEVMSHVEGVPLQRFSPPRPVRLNGETDTVDSTNRKRTYDSVPATNLIPAGATTLDDLIDSLQGSLDRLRAMKARGVVLHDGSDPRFTVLATDDPAVAAEFGFDLYEEDEEE